MELTLDDVRQLALELWLAQRDNDRLRTEITELRANQARRSDAREGHPDADSRG